MIAAIVVSIILFLLYWLKFDSNIIGFFRVGDTLPFSPYLNLETAKIYQGELGFDGQQFLSIAFDPLLQNPDTVKTLDSAPLRYRRIFYPLVSYILAAGNRQLIPYIMVGINAIAIAIIVWIVSCYHEVNKYPQFPALLVLLLPGVWIVLSLSTADLLNSALVLAALYSYRIKQLPWMAVWIAIASLTRETSLVMWFSLLVVSIWEQQYRAIKPLILAVIPPIVWNSYVLIRFHDQGVLGVNANFGYPFAGIVEKFKLLFVDNFSGKDSFEIYCFGLLVIVFIFNLVFGKINQSENKIIAIGSMIYGIMFLMSSIAMLSYFLNYPRQFINPYFLFLLLQGSKRMRWSQSCIAGLLGVSSLVFLLGHSWIQ